jgi:hypothetical protein
MPPRRRIGEYRHTPAPSMQVGADGVLRHSRVRRRFPQQGIVPLAYGLAGPLVCAGVSRLLLALFGPGYLPRRADGHVLPPAPSVDNVLFGAGPHEVALACALVGWWLWLLLWNTRLPESVMVGGPRATFGPLVGRALGLGLLLTYFVAMPIGIVGLYIRTAPADQPWFVRPFFGLLAVLPLSVSYIISSAFLLVLLLLGLLLGAATAAAVALLWPHYPEEPVLK